MQARSKRWVWVVFVAVPGELTVGEVEEKEIQ
jgi:hypothetical protein